MAVKTFQVTKIYVKQLFCDKCNVEMKPHRPAVALMPGGPQRFTHKCPKCGWTETLTEPYPMQFTDVVEVMEEPTEQSELKAEENN